MTDTATGSPVGTGEVGIDPSRGSADEARRIARIRQAERERVVALRRVEILERRRSGYTFAEIAAVMSLSEEGVRKAYRSALKDHYRAASAEERETTLLRVDGVIRRWWPKLLSDDDEVADRATRNLMRAMDYQADMWGWKSHTVHVEGEVRNPMPTGAEVWQALQQIREAEARRQRGEVVDATATVVPALITGTNGSAA